MTDYGILLLTYVAKGSAAEVRTTRDLAACSRLPLPTVEKLLKALSRSKFLLSERGVKGGYRLARNPEEIRVADVIEALEGPIALTSCSKSDYASQRMPCEVQSHCPVQTHWQVINQTVRQALQDLTLAQLLVSRPGLVSRLAQKQDGNLYDVV